jgi:hypothetical protein
MSFSTFPTDSQEGSTYNITITAMIENDVNTENDQRDEQLITTENQAPAKPIIQGPTQGRIGEPHTYKITTTDPNGHDVSYWIVWYQGCPGGTWQGPYQSGEIITRTYTYETRGNYVIRVKARDSFGLESDWGELAISMPREPWIMSLLHRFQFLFPLFQDT